MDEPLDLSQRSSRTSSQESQEPTYQELVYRSPSLSTPLPVEPTAFSQASSIESQDSAGAAFSQDSAGAAFSQDSGFSQDSTAVVSASQDAVPSQEDSASQAVLPTQEVADLDTAGLTPLVKDATRRTLLITYSRADTARFPTRESFGECVVETVNTLGGAKVEYWACALEEHQAEGMHYHVCLKLTAPRRWAPIRRELDAQHGVKANFSEDRNSSGYITAYRYCTKEDSEVFHSPNHPQNLQGTVIEAH